MTEAAIPLRDTSSISRYPIGMQLRLGTQRSVWTQIFYIQSTHDIFLSLYTALFGLRLLQSNPAMIGQHAAARVKSRQQRSQGPGLCHDRRIIRQLVHHRRRQTCELLVVAAR